MDEQQQSVQEKTQEAPQQNKSGSAIASLVLGIIGIIAWILPLVGFPVTIVGLVLGFKGKSSDKKGLAIAGIVLCIITLIFTALNSIMGAYLGAIGKLY